MSTETLVKDVKPGLKNLNLIFIVLETGGCDGGGVPAPPPASPRPPDPLHPPSPQAG